MTKQLHEEMKRKALIADNLQLAIDKTNLSIKQLSNLSILSIGLTLGIYNGTGYVELPHEIEAQFLEVTKGLLMFHLKNTEKKYEAL